MVVWSGEESQQMGVFLFFLPSLGKSMEGKKEKKEKIIMIDQISFVY